MVYSDKAWNNERIFDSDMNRMENGIGGRCAKAVVDPAGTKGDYATIQAAINAIVAAGGGTIFLRSGIHNVVAPLTVVHGTDKVEIIGEKGAVIRCNASFVFPLLKIGQSGGIGTSDYVRLANFVIDANFSVQANSGDVVQIWGANKCWVEGVTVVDSDPTNGAIYVAQSDEVYVNSNHIYDMDGGSGGYGIRIDADRVTIQGNVISGNGGGGGIHVQGCELGDVTGNHVINIDTGLEAVRINGCDYVTVQGNSCDSAGYFCIVTGAFHHVVIKGNTGTTFDTNFILATSTAVGSEDLVIMGNSFEICNFIGFDLQFAQPVDNVVIVGNTMEDCQREGIKVSNVDGLVVSENAITDPCQAANNTYDGISIGSGNYGTVVGNCIVSVAANKMRDGINETAGNWRNISSNTTKGAQTTGQVKTGANSQIVNGLDAP